MKCGDPHEHDDHDGFDPNDEWDEPVGSCEWCGGNLYPDTDWDGLCDSCAWHAEQNRGADDGEDR